MKEENKNMILLVLIVVGVMTGWHFMYDAPRQEALKAEQAEQKVAKVNVPIQPTLPIAATVTKAITRAESVQAAERVQIDTPSLTGSINPRGATLDDLVLNDYKQTVDPKSANIELLSPEGTANPYNIQFDWITADKDVIVPDANTVWMTTSSEMSPEKPVTFTWDNNQGLRFEKTFAVDNNYLFTVTQKVTNSSNKIVKLYPMGKIRRVGTPKTSGYMVVHEGLIGFFNGKLDEINYEDLKEKKQIRFQTKGGWIGITDQFWLTAFIPKQDKGYEFFENYIPPAGAEREAYETGYFADVIELKPGETHELTNSVFAGAKVLDLLDAYEPKLQVEHFDKAVDFGWFYFITKPLFYFLQWLHNLLGNFGLAILIITILVRILFFPLANKSFKSMARMKQLQPKMERIKEQYGDDKMRMNQEMMELYKREKVNPLGGCLPMVVQIPVFFALYKVLFVSIEMRHAPFYGWIQDLSAPDPTSIFNLFGLIPWDPPTMLMIGAWPLIMGGTMILQQKLNPAPADPVQAKMFMLMPIMFTYLFASFPAGLVIYWAWGNILSIAQQYMIILQVDKSGK